MHPHGWKCTQIAPTKLFTLGDHIKRHRLALHMFQAELAKHLGVDRVQVQNWERNVLVMILASAVLIAAW